MRHAARPTLTALAATMLALTAGAGAQGLTTCDASPDGGRVAVGGYNRAVIVYDTSDWTVEKRLWIGAWVRHVAFSHDASRCLVLDQAERLHLYDTADWSKLRTVVDVKAMAVADQAGVAVTAGGPDDANGLALHVWDLPAGEHRAAIAVPDAARRELSQVAVSPDGTAAYARTVGFDNPDQRDTELPESEDGFGERRINELRTDGKSSAILVFDLGEDTFVKQVVCFDHPTVSQLRRDRMFVFGDRVVTAVYSGYVGVLHPAEATYGAVLHGELAYGSGRSPLGELYVGSLREFAALGPDGKELTDRPVRIDPLPGWPEYFCWFAPLGADRVVAVTSAYRIVVINTRSREVTKLIHCY
jgi:hypothetical protein